jgi:hypothetical protein
MICYKGIAACKDLNQNLGRAREKALGGHGLGGSNKQGEAICNSAEETASLDIQNTPLERLRKVGSHGRKR